MRKITKLGDPASILAEYSRKVIDRCLVLAKYMMHIRYIIMCLSNSSPFAHCPTLALLSSGHLYERVQQSILVPCLAVSAIIRKIAKWDADIAVLAEEKGSSDLIWLCLFAFVCNIDLNYAFWFCVLAQTHLIVLLAAPYPSYRRTWRLWMVNLTSWRLKRVIFKISFLALGLLWLIIYYIWCHVWTGKT